MTDIDYSIPMDPTRVDSAGHKPLPMIGQQYRHWKTKRVYRVEGFTWDGERDLWLIVHVDSEEARRAGLAGNRTEFARSFDNFFEMIFTGEGRGDEDPHVIRMERVS